VLYAWFLDQIKLDVLWIAECKSGVTSVACVVARSARLGARRTRGPESVTRVLGSLIEVLVIAKSTVAVAIALARALAMVLAVAITMS
jgi:hypothetical protein